MEIKLAEFDGVYAVKDFEKENTVLASKAQDGDIFGHYYLKNDKKAPYRNLKLCDTYNLSETTSFLVIEKRKLYKWYQFWIKEKKIFMRFVIIQNKH